MARIVAANCIRAASVHTTPANCAAGTRPFPDSTGFVNKVREVADQQPAKGLASPNAGPLGVVLEVLSTRSFACAIQFPGWFGYGRTPEAAIERLLAYRARYAPIARSAKRTLPENSTLVILEQLQGNGTTQFGAPGQIAQVERTATATDLRRLRALHAACRDFYEDVLTGAPATLRKGPRGGGRDTDRVANHVVETERTYATRLRTGTWPEAYYLRRSAYHFTDHAWEIQDRSEPT